MATKGKPLEGAARGKARSLARALTAGDPQNIRNCWGQLCSILGGRRDDNVIAKFLGKDLAAKLKEIPGISFEP